MLAWMAWTWQTALFFAFIGLALVILTLLAIFRPQPPWPPPPLSIRHVV